MPQILRAALLALALSSPVQTPALTTMSDIPASAHPEIVRVDCLIGRGTAFRVGNGLYLSVNHVTGLFGCYINNEPLNVVSHVDDFSILATKTKGPALTVDCGGFIKGRKYRALGFARGLDTLTEVDLIATGDTDSDFAILSGVWTVIPGQSGGPVLDAETGKVVGTINVYDMVRGISGSTELRGTSICNGANT